MPASRSAIGHGEAGSSCRASRSCRPHDARPGYGAFAKSLANNDFMPPWAVAHGLHRRLRDRSTCREVASCQVSRQEPARRTVLPIWVKLQAGAPALPRPLTVATTTVRLPPCLTTMPPRSRPRRWPARGSLPAPAMRALPTRSRPRTGQTSPEPPQAAMTRRHKPRARSRPRMLNHRATNPRMPNKRPI